MKKLIIATVILLATTVETFAGPVVTVKVEIGRKSTGCTRFGICSITVGVESKFTTMQINDRTNELQLICSKESIAGKEEYFEGKTAIVFEEAVIIPSNVQKALGYNSTITIAKGSYKLVKTLNGYQINVPLNVLESTILTK